MLLHLIRVEHHFECLEELSPIDHSVRVVIDRPYSLKALCLGNDGIDADAPEEIVEEEGHFMDVEGAVAIGVVLVEDRLDIVFDHFVLKRTALHH
jgi:hypothetical protein